MAEAANPRALLTEEGHHRGLPGGEAEITRGSLEAAVLG